MFDCLIINRLWLKTLDAHDKIFTKWHTLLKPSGKLLFATLGPDTLKEMVTEPQALKNHRRVMPDMHDLGDDLVRSNWQAPVLDRGNILVSYPNANYLQQDLQTSDWLSSLYPNFHITLQHFANQVSTDFAPLDLTFELIFAYASA